MTQSFPRLRSSDLEIYEEIINTELAEELVFLINEKQLNVERGSFVKNFFKQDILRTLVPIMLDGEKKFPKLKDGSIYFIVRLSGRNKNVPASKALVELPTQLLPRFLVLPETGKLKYIIFLDDVIRYCLNIVFSIFEIGRAHV